MRSDSSRFSELAFEARLAAAYALLAHWQGMRPPIDVADQAEAAARDAHEVLERIGAVEELVAPGRLHGFRELGDPAGHRRARVLAGVLACLRSRCWHLRTGGPQPAVVALAVRRIDCLRCAHVQRRPVVADDRCDVCGELVPDNVFWPLMVNLGATVVLGDMCRRCAEIIIPEAAA